MYKLIILILIIFCFCGLSLAQQDMVWPVFVDQFGDDFIGKQVMIKVNEEEFVTINFKLNHPDPQTLSPHAFMTEIVNGIAKIAPIPPSIQVQKINETNITKSERSSSSPIYLGLMIFSTIPLMTTKPTITISACVGPNSTKAKKAGAITLSKNPILGIKLNKKERKAQRRQNQLLL